MGLMVYSECFLGIPLIGILLTIATCNTSGVAGMSLVDYASLDSAVKQIVHPLASPTQGMITVATAHGSPPTTVQQILEYQPHMVSLARTMGVKPPGRDTLESYIQQRSLQWLQQHNMQTGDEGLFGNLGNWIMRMFFENMF